MPAQVQLSERSGDMELELDGPLDTDDTAGGQPGDAAGGGAAAGSACAPEPVSPAAKSALPSEAPAQDSSMSRVQVDKMPAACLLSKKKGRPPPPYHLLPAPKSTALSLRTPLLSYT